ncbi:hypothetical protein PAPYR_4640 [Paratrimastix pyriformis]|uniref:Uncharacterized protein n=1 Tax=Paratrimastix pyriformis TaxID=342808 RepID=A0ABQ8UJE6_9EUKA|nr:hypothetical protein PAPYR_4640 [Paratrimastix pyriformis]
MGQTESAPDPHPPPATPTSAQSHHQHPRPQDGFHLLRVVFMRQKDCEMDPPVFHTNDESGYVKYYYRADSPITLDAKIKFPSGERVSFQDHLRSGNRTFWRHFKDSPFQDETGRGTFELLYQGECLRRTHFEVVEGPSFDDERPRLTVKWFCSPDSHDEQSPDNLVFRTSDLKPTVVVSARVPCGRSASLKVEIDLPGEQRTRHSEPVIPDHKLKSFHFTGPHSVGTAELRILWKRTGEILYRKHFRIAPAILMPLELKIPLFDQPYEFVCFTHPGHVFIFRKMEPIFPEQVEPVSWQNSDGKLVTTGCALCNFSFCLVNFYLIPIPCVCTSGAYWGVPSKRYEFTAPPAPRRGTPSLTRIRALLPALWSQGTGGVPDSTCQWSSPGFFILDAHPGYNVNGWGNERLFHDRRYCLLLQHEVYNGQEGRRVTLTCERVQYTYSVLSGEQISTMGGGDDDDVPRRPADWVEQQEREEQREREADDDGGGGGGGGWEAPPEPAYEPPPEPAYEPAYEPQPDYGGGDYGGGDFGGGGDWG